MTGSITDVVKQFKNDWTCLLEPGRIPHFAVGSEFAQYGCR